MAIEKVAPIVRDEVEFYVSVDGSKCGTSVNGLQRLVGMKDGGYLNKLLKEIHEGAKTTPKPLESLLGKVFRGELIGANGAKIVDAKAAARILRYYAYEAKNTYELAAFSYDKFAEMGVETWIKKVTDFKTDVDQKTTSLMNAEVLAAMQLLIAEVQETKAIAKEYNDIRHVTVSIYPGLDSMLDQLPDIKSLPSSKNMVTAREWLALKGVTLTHDRMTAFGRLVADTFKSMTGKRPSDKLDKVGVKWVKIGKGYTEEHYPILETAWKQFAS